MGAETSRPELRSRGTEISELCQPENAYCCDGSGAAYRRWVRLVVERGTARPRDPKQRSDGYRVFSDPADVDWAETREIWNFVSGCGGNALLDRKRLAPRNVSGTARDDGWLSKLPGICDDYAVSGSRVPQALCTELDGMRGRREAAQ